MTRFRRRVLQLITILSNSNASPQGRRCTRLVAPKIALLANGVWGNTRKSLCFTEANSRFQYRVSCATRIMSVYTVPNSSGLSAVDDNDPCSNISLVVESTKFNVISTANGGYCQNAFELPQPQPTNSPSSPIVPGFGVPGIGVGGNSSDSKHATQKNSAKTIRPDSLLPIFALVALFQIGLFK